MDQRFSVKELESVASVKMGNRSKFLLVSGISISRLLTALIFASVVDHVSPLLRGSLYFVAMGSDLLDGYLARLFKVESYFGGIIDLLSDKSLTMISLLFAVYAGIDVLPLALIATREVLGLGTRMIVFEGAALLPTNRTFGRVMLLAVWGNTFFLIIAGAGNRWTKVANMIYWVCAVVVTFAYLMRVTRNTQRIKRFLKQIVTIP